MERFEELKKVFYGLDETARKIAGEMLEDVVFIEKRLDELRKLPFIQINPKNPAQQRPTPAAKQYKELLQQYNNCIKILLGIAKHSGAEDLSPLRQYAEERKRRLHDTKDKQTS